MSKQGKNGVMGLNDVEAYDTKPYIFKLLEVGKEE